MITKPGLKVFARNINVSYSLGFTPFKFEFSQLKIILTPTNKSQIIKYYLNFCIQLMYVIYSLVRISFTFIHRHHLRLKYSHLFWMILFGLSEVWGLGNMISVRRTIQEIYGFLNALVTHSLRLSEGKLSMLRVSA